MLALSGIEAGYNESMVLRRVQMSVRKGQVVCMMGRNGVGKTTLMRTITGQLRAKSGYIQLGGHDITKQDMAKRAKRGIGYVPQGRDIFPMLTVMENLLLGLEACRVRTKEVPKDVMELFPVLGSMLKRQGGDLSGGQQQQLAIARALASRPKLLILDEPTEGIQPSIVEDIREVIHHMKHTGMMSILLVEQSIEFVRSVADYVYVMDKGTIAYQGNPNEMDMERFEHYLTV